MISASAVTVASRCLRRAAFKYGSDVEPAPEPESEAVSMGKAGHAILEAYQKDGTQPPHTDLGDLCRKGLSWLPHPGQANAEGLFHVTISGVPYMGYIDLESPENRIFPGITEGGIPAVVDYKFSKSPERYGIRTPTDFFQDPQALLYAAYSFVKYGTSRVFLRWLKFRTRGKAQVYPVDAILTRRVVAEAFGRVVHPHATRLVSIRERKMDPNSFAPNFEACHDFGRPCPYMGSCERGKRMSLLDEMRSLVGDQVQDNGAQQRINPSLEEAALKSLAKVRQPEPVMRVLLEELGSALTRAAGRV